MGLDRYSEIHITYSLDQSALHGGGVGRMSGDTVLAIERAVNDVEWRVTRSFRGDSPSSRASRERAPSSSGLHCGIQHRFLYIQGQARNISGLLIRTNLVSYDSSHFDLPRDTRLESFLH